jgi:ceramide glucosyltransferase
MFTEASPLFLFPGRPRLMYVFYFFAVIAVWLGLQSLRGGLRFRAYVRREVESPRAEYAPFVSVIAPFRGLEPGLRENLTALFDQDYPAYEIIFVTDRADDPASALVEEVQVAMSDKLRSVADPHRGIASRLVIAGAAVESGQKVHNLRVAVNTVNEKSEALVFVDTDARPHADWLRSLVGPLAHERIGAATGYRWFAPDRGGLASWLRSAWNASIASALGERSDKNFCWGGSTAIRRQTFADLQIAERWRGTISDDFTLTRVLQEAHLPIHFVPQCLIVSADSCNFRELLEFTTRQVKITRCYAAHLWQAILLGSSLFVLVFFGGLLLLTMRALSGKSVAPAVIMLAIILVLGAAKSWVRLRAVELALDPYRQRPPLGLPAHLLLWPFASGLFLYNALAASWSRRIKWRGLSYELKSPTEAVIIAREPH